MPDPTIIIDPYSEGAHNAGGSSKRVLRQGFYRDNSTVCVIPTLGSIPSRVVQTWWNLMAPMNGVFIRVFVNHMEVGNAYSTAIEQILAHPQLAACKFILTLEHDNMPPSDGLINLLAAANEHPEFSAIGGLYWTKGEGGQPMIYGNPHEIPFNFRPQPPNPPHLVECNGLGMGFTLFRTKLFMDERIERPWFRTVQQNGMSYTQDLHFFERARGAGHRFACHCGVGVGHYDPVTDLVW